MNITVKSVEYCPDSETLSLSSGKGGLVIGNVTPDVGDRAMNWLNPRIGTTVKVGQIETDTEQFVIFRDTSGDRLVVLHRL
jgi:hypothetical protein